jgi:hypothetical protein
LLAYFSVCCFACSAYASTEKEAVWTSETSVNFYKATRLHLTEVGTIHGPIIDSGKYLVQITGGDSFCSLKQNWKTVNTKESGPSFLICRKFFVIAYILRRGVVCQPQAGGSPLVGCPRLFIQYIRSYSPYLEAVFSIRNLRTRHAVVTKDPPLLVQKYIVRHTNKFYRVSEFTFVIFYHADHSGRAI